MRRKLAVVFDHDARIRAETTNISREGLCISSDFVAVPGTVVGGALIVPSGENANFEAAVIWARKVRGAEALTAKNTMGLEFIIPPGESYDQLFPQSHQPTVAAPAQAAAPETPVRSPRPPAPLPKVSDDRAPLWLRPPAGQVGQVTATVQEAHLAAPADRFISSITPSVAASLIEHACSQTIASSLSPPGLTAGVGLQLNVSQIPLLVGTTLTATARVTQVSADGMSLVFDVSISDGRREIATARHSRVICLPQR